LRAGAGGRAFDRGCTGRRARRYPTRWWLSGRLQLFGGSQQTESSWEDSLSEAHTRFILTFIEQEQARDAAAIESFLASREH
jgi:hypothetical protein